MSVRGPSNVGRAVQTDPTFLRYTSAITEQKKCWESLAEKFDRCQTLRNNTQQHPTTCNRVCKRTQHVTSNNVGSCWSTMLRPFAPSQTFQPTTPNISFVPWSPERSATMLDPFTQLFQHCLGHACSLRTVYKDFWVVSFRRCNAGPNIVGSCCIRLHTTANRHASTPNIVGATTLGVVASVCTQPNGQNKQSCKSKYCTGD